MVTRNEATPDATATTQRAATPRHGADEARKDASSPTKDRRAQGAKEDKERSDWEGMNPRPEQGSDDVAAPGEVPHDPA